MSIETQCILQHSSEDSRSHFSLSSVLLRRKLWWRARTGSKVTKWKGAWLEEAIRLNIFAGRKWSGGAMEHYASEIRDRKLPEQKSSNYPHQSKIKALITSGTSHLILI